VPHEVVMHKASMVLAAGADFRLMGPHTTQVKSTKPVVSICAVRTGSGKSQTTRRVSKILIDLGYRVAAIRHPMPYGDLVSKPSSAYADYSDLVKHECTIEEREEYEPHLDNGVIVYAGVDYEAILRQAEKEVDIVLWDGGNNDSRSTSRSADRGRRPAPPRTRDQLPPRRDEFSHGGCIRDQQVDTTDHANVTKSARQPARSQPERGSDRSRLAAVRG